MPPPKQKPGKSKQDYSTPKNFILAVKRRLRIIDFAFDFAANAKNTKARRYFSARDNALSDDHRRYWENRCSGDGRWGWLNPPFDDITPWALACSQALHLGGANIAFLVPASVGSNWFRDSVDGNALVLLLNGRLAFMPTKPKWLYPKDCILALYSPSIKPGYEVWNWRQP